MANSPKPAVLLINFNRVDATKKSLQAIRNWKPVKLYLACDGPRADHPEDVKTIESVKALLTKIDWPCEVQQLYQSKNLGCKNGPLSAIDWLFENESKGIILEDDCIPSLSFFDFASAMLEQYEANDKIWHIAGSNFINLPKTNSDSYFFSKYPHIWGWATWRSRWLNAKRNYEELEQLSKNEFITDILADQPQFQYWNQAFELCRDNKMDAWDYMWTYSMWVEQKFAIIPALNMVSNIGFEKSATHHKVPVKKLTNIQTHDLSNIQHPNKIESSGFDEKIWKEILKPIFIPSFLSRIQKRLGSFFQK